MVYLENKPYLNYLVIVILGILYTISFAPYSFKIGVYLSLALFFYILFHSDKRTSIYLSYLFGLSVFSFGTSWIFNSLYDYGGENLTASLLVTIFLILFISIFFIPLGMMVNKDIVTKKIFNFLMPASILVLIELIRSNIFGGFPWLLVGTSQIGTIFDAFYPLFGTYFVSFLTILISSLIAVIMIGKNIVKHSIILFLVLLSVNIINSIEYNWSTDKKAKNNITIIQPNINQRLKFNSDEIKSIKDKYLEIFKRDDLHDIVLLPETAIPTIYQNDKNFYKEKLLSRADYIIGGVFRYDNVTNETFNSILVLNNKEQFYDKRHLVPFGEYIPFKSLFIHIMKVFNIPMSNLSHGKNYQSRISFDDIFIEPLICYESAYPQLIETTNKEFSIIVNISNDAWFGNSLAPYQHLEISQSRALEFQRFLVRSANTGISAVVNKDGEIVDAIPLNHEGILNASITSSKGKTPYRYFGDYPILMLIFSIMFFYFFTSNKYE
ncbi:MAG: apolipoprotein N-acyltransferase [Gammaproteobacteria bacterium]|jgi:apolipoprotein N-acyltransferase|nr:apolipoprotein N-acyltransferase [Gammaproteobacteria bacterium]|tara:strand:- start:1702 stop:3186 length:1485 start_codon:yes stop_codon:yes gene_type:complete